MRDIRRLNNAFDHSLPMITKATKPMTEVAFVFLILEYVPNYLFSYIYVRCNAILATVTRIIHHSSVGLPELT